MHESTNDNGELMVNFALENEMLIASTVHQHKNIHKGTWVSLDGQTINQTDHVLINHKKRSVIQDVRSLRGPDCESCNYLVKTVIQQKLLINKTKNQFQGWNLHNFMIQRKYNGKLLRTLYLMQQMITSDMRQGNDMTTGGAESVN
jgi:hypothetical protein